MDTESVIMQKHGRNEENTVQYAIESLKSKQESLVSNKLDLEQTPTSKFTRSRTSSSSLELIHPNSNNLHSSSIPKHITTFDEQCVLHCLELIRNYALRAANGNFASKVHILPDELSNLASLNMAKLSIESPIGSITNSQSMINILNSPLLQQFGSVDFDINFGRNSVHDLSGSPQEKEVNVVDHEYVYGRGHNSNFSTISVNSDKTSSSASTSATSFQGMIQSTWKNGLPQHVFSVDDKKEVYYIADLSKVESLDNNGLDYVYTFRSRESHLGTMRVFTSTTFDSNNSEIRETRFILSISSDDSKRELEISNHIHRKNKTLTQKMGRVLKSSLSYKQRSFSKFSGSSVIFEDAPSEDVYNSVENYVPNLEVAAIVVKDVYKADFGGWGLKFLKKSENDASRCSTSMDVIIPRGVHGGPKTRVGGPSNLFERWISGGMCDCGGWDLGCPLTVLESGLSSKDSSSGNCKSVDLFVQGSKEDIPMLKMANIHEGLYYINFQSTLSALQTFAIAAAIIHCHSPLLRSKVYSS